ncbi:MAG: hypothetical protein K2N95_12080 [Lachnospiraceae bacterium]|nr:hypothetical protein [Lachnospiraceae bacterium]
MKKTQIIKEAVGKKLEPYGFKYLKTDHAAYSLDFERYERAQLVRQEVE